MTVHNVNGIVDVKYAAVPGATWGTAVACGAGRGIFGLKDGFDKKQPNMPNMATGMPWESDADPGLIVAPFGHDAELTYDGLLLLLAMAFGTSPVPTKVGATLAYKHQMQLADNKYGLYFTYVKNYLVNIFEGASVKITEIDISGPNKDGRIDVAFKGTAFDCVQGSVTNTLITFANVTWPYKGNRVLWKQCVVRMNPQGNAALAGGDAVNPSKFKLNIKWPMKGEYTTQFGNNVDEPTKDGRPELTLTLTFPRYNDAGKALIDAFDAGTLYKADMMFTTSALIETAFPWSMAFRFPQLRLEKPEQPFNAATIPQSIILRGQMPAAPSLGMAAADIGYDLLRPCGLDVVCLQSTGALV